MKDKKALTAAIELGTALVVLYAQDKSSRASLYLTVCKASMWTAEKFGRLAMIAELKYRKEVM